MATISASPPQRLDTTATLCIRALAATMPKGSSHTEGTQTAQAEGRVASVCSGDSLPVTLPPGGDAQVLGEACEVGPFGTAADHDQAAAGVPRRLTALGGFDAQAYGRPGIEDIDFGPRLRDNGDLILLDPSIQGSHHKRWTLASMVVTDIRQRAIPWRRLLLGALGAYHINYDNIMLFPALLAILALALHRPTLWNRLLAAAMAASLWCPVHLTADRTGPQSLMAAIWLAVGLTLLRNRPERWRPSPQAPLA